MDPTNESTLLNALGKLTHGVYVLATRRGHEMSAMTAAWLTRTSERPPYLAAAVREDHYTHDRIIETGTFALSILRDDQVDVAVHFGETSSAYHDKLQGVPYSLSPGGSPYLLDCLAYLDCRLRDTMRAGDHTVLIGEVMSGETLDPGYPLVYDPSEYEEALR